MMLRRVAREKEAMERALEEGFRVDGGEWRQGSSRDQVEVEDSDEREFETGLLHGSLLPKRPIGYGGRGIGPPGFLPRKSKKIGKFHPVGPLELDLFPSPSPPTPKKRKRGRLSSGSESEEEEESEFESPPREILPPTTKIEGKKKKALRMMMPAIFMKKAQADLELMEEERLEGRLSVGSLNSGDEAGSGSSSEEVEERTNIGKYRLGIRKEGKLNFNKEVFTDESGTAESQSEEETEEEDTTVTGWLSNFAPRKGNDFGGDDIIDRLMKQARGARKKERSDNRRRKQTKLTKAGGQASTSKPKESKSKTKIVLEKSIPAVKKKAMEDPSIYRYHPTTPNIPLPRKQPRRPVIPLDTDAAIFAAYKEHERTLPKPKKPLRAIFEPITAPAKAPPTKEAGEGERWAAYGKFSHDFEIGKLPLGIRFTSHSLLTTGYFTSFLESGSLPPLVESINCFGIELESFTELVDLLGLLPGLCDAIYDDLLEEEDRDSSKRNEAELGFQFLGNYISAVVNACAEDRLQSRFVGTTMGQFEQLVARLEELEERFDEIGYNRRFKLKRISIGWYILEISIRCIEMVYGEERERAIERSLDLITLLVRRLIAFGAEHTTKSLKDKMNTNAEWEEEAGEMKDPSVEVWCCLIHLSLDSNFPLLTEEKFWELVEGTVLDSLALTTAATRGPIGGEILSYTSMMLCAISQFNPQGVTTASPHLSAFWSIMLRALEPLQPSLISKTETLMSNTALGRRDRYLWTLYARVLVFVYRWEWKMDGKTKILPKLFDILNARTLANLSTEPNSDFPAFFSNLDLESIDTELDVEVDTSFTIFLKLVIIVKKSLEFSSEVDKKKQLSKFFLRISPMRACGWTSKSKEILKTNSILVNHCALYLTFTLLEPKLFLHRLEQVRALIVFGEVTEESRRNYIRTLLYFGQIYRRNGMSLLPTMESFALITILLRKEYGDLQKDRRILEITAAKAKGVRMENIVHESNRTNPMWYRAVLLTMILRSVQIIMKDKIDSILPDPCLLHPAWIDQLLTSLLALDTMIGFEVLKTINSYLDLRTRAIPKQEVILAQPEENSSQDEYGILDFDYEDPALNAMMGVIIETPAWAVKDKAFAEIVKSRLTPALYQLICNLMISDATQATLVERLGYLEKIVECWARCIFVAIENGLMVWSPFLRYGEQCWKKLSEPLGKRTTGLLLAVQIIKYDPELFLEFHDEFMDIWFQSIAARTQTSQHLYTGLLLDLKKPPALFEGFPFTRSSSGKYSISARFLAENRVTILGIAFRNIAKALALPEIGTVANGFLLPLPATRQVPRSIILNLLRALLSSMKDDVANAPTPLTRKNYLEFCQEVLEKINFCGPLVSEKVLPDLRIMNALVKELK